MFLDLQQYHVTIAIKTAVIIIAKMKAATVKPDAEFCSGSDSERLTTMSKAIVKL